MGLLQQACKTYDCHSDLVGIYKESSKAVLAPIAHITVKLNIIITIDMNGDFIGARETTKDESKAIIPASIESMSRTSSPCAHPLCDQIEFIANYNKVKRDLYETKLRDWKDSQYGHWILDAVYKYVTKNTIVSDLKSIGLIEINDDGTPKNDKIFIGWKVEKLDDGSSVCCWQDVSLMNSYISFYLNSLPDDESLCMLSGFNEYITTSHMKGVVPLFGNAKIISSNDKDNFTYLGRFKSDVEALSVGYEHSQKAHNALKWLIENQGFIRGSRVFLCWNPEGRRIPVVINPLISNAKEKVEPSDYKKKLIELVHGFGNNGIIGNETVIITTFEAATAGRLAITYYSELNITDFLNRLKEWDEYCSFYDSRFGMSSPSLDRIIRCAYGVEREDKGIKKLVTDDKEYSRNIQRLITCKVESQIIPRDIYNLLVNRSNNLMLYDSIIRAEILHTACSVIRKYQYDRNKEEISMGLDVDNKDRSYQYGRLLALLEKAEEDAFWQRDNEVRETNALRMQAIFSKRPRNTSRILIEQFKNAYYPRLKASSKVFYEKAIGDIFDKLSEYSENELNKALEDSYLIGYYAQKNELYKSKKNKEVEDNGSTTE